MSNIHFVFIASHLLLAPAFGNGKNGYNYQDNWNGPQDNTEGHWSDDRKELQDNVDNVTDDGLFGRLHKASGNLSIVTRKWDHLDKEDTWNGTQHTPQGYSPDDSKGSKVGSIILGTALGMNGVVLIVALIWVMSKRSGAPQRQQQRETRAVREVRGHLARENPTSQNRHRAPLQRQDSAVREVQEYLARMDPTFLNRDQDAELALINENHEVYGQAAGIEITGNAAGGCHSSRKNTDEIDRQISVEVEELLELHNGHLKSPPVHLEVKRDEILQDLLQRYNDPALAQKRVTVKMKGERGMDCGGVTNDMFTTFWNEVQEKYFKGNEAVVPYLPKNRRNTEEKHYRVFGRILSHTVAVTKALPMPLCKSAIIVMIFNTNHVDEQAILEDFLLYMDQEDRHLITTAINNFATLEREQIDKIQEFFTRYDYPAVVQERNFINHLNQIARDTICIRPKYLLEPMREGIPESHLKHFWSILNITYLKVLFRALRPSRQDILNCVRTESSERNLTQRQQRVFRYLCYLIQELNQTELEAFLHFVTGKKSMPRRGITVGFTNETGLQRTPKAHTCSNMLELPETYENYNVFKSEFKHLLAAEEAFTMTMV